MRPRELSLIASALVAFAVDARADDCLDASDRARSELQARHLLAARMHLHACAAATCEEALRTLCEERLTEVVQRLPTVVFDLKDGDGNDVPDVKIAVDGAAAPEPPGVEMTLDPGAHTFQFDHAGLTEVRSLVLLEREKGRRERIVLGATRLVRAVLPAPTPSTRPEGSSWRVIGAITMAAGAVGLGLGTAFGIMAINEDSNADCDASNVCGDPRSRHDARVHANVSTVSFLTGGALAAAGVALYIFGPRLSARW